MQASWFLREDGVVFVEVAYGWHDLGALVESGRGE